MQNPPTPCLKGVGFLRACLLAALPSRALLPPCERDARAPSTRCAGNAGVPPAMPTARGKTYPFKPPVSPSSASRERGNARIPLSHPVGEGLKSAIFNTNRAGGVYNCPPPLGLKGVGFFLAWSGLRAGRPRSQCSACWERERLARMEAEMPCSATPRASTPEKNPTPLRGTVRPQTRCA